MTIKFEDLAILYPDNFIATNPNKITNIPNNESFIGVNIKDENYYPILDKYYDECKIAANKLAKLRAHIKQLRTLDFSSSEIKMTTFNAKYIADFIKFKDMFGDISKVFDKVPGATSLFPHLLADAFINLDPKNTMKYEKAEVTEYINKKFQEILDYQIPN